MTLKIFIVDMTVNTWVETQTKWSKLWSTNYIYRQKSKIRSKSLHKSKVNEKM